MISSDSIGLLFRAKGDTSDAKKSFSDLKDSISKDAKSIETSVEGADGKSGGFLSKLTSGLGGVPGIATAAVAGITAVATAAVATATTLFKLAENASEFGSAIKDASDKTGLSAETLSSLKLAADQSGSSLEQISGSVTKFSKLIGDAAEGSDKAKESLIRLGLDPKTAIDDLDGSLAIVFKRIADAENPIIATKLATEAFGKSGADIIPVIKSFDGDMAGLIARAKELGVAIDDKAANAADDFGDSLDTLKAQTQAVANQFAFQFMPVMTKGMKDLSFWFTQNKSSVVEWGASVGNVLAGIIKIAKDTVQFFNDHPWLLTLAQSPLSVGTKIVEKIGANANQITSTADLRQADDTNTSTKSPFTSDGLTDFNADKERTEALKKRLAEFGEANKLAVEGLRQTYEASQRAWAASLEKGELTFEDYKKNLLENIENFAAASRRLLEQGFNIASQGKTGQDLKNANTAYANALAKFNDEIQKQKEDLAKQERETKKKDTDDRLKSLENENKRTLALDKSSTETRLAQLKADLQDRKITEIQYVNAVAAIKTGAIKTEKELLQKELTQYDARSEKYADTTAKIKELDDELTRQLIENADAAAEAYDRARQARDPNGNPGEEGESRTGSSAGPAADLFLGESILTQIDEAGNRVANFSNAWTALKDIAGEALSSLAQGVGNMVQNLVLMGNLGGQSIRKLVASVLAGVAAQAATLAIMELAYGFAALTPWGAAIYGPAPLHFKAAALFGSIALVTGVLGRGIAGDSFKQQTSGAYGTSSGTSSGGGSSSGSGGEVYSTNRDKQILDMARNTSASVPQTTVVISDRSGMFGEFFTAEVSRNGKTRDAIKKITDS